MCKNQSTLLSIILILIASLLVSCGQPDLQAPTATEINVASVTLTPILPTATPTATVQSTFTPTLVMETAVSTYTPRPTITPTPTATPFPKIAWANNNLISHLNGRQLRWSPNQNEFIFTHCELLQTDENELIFFVDVLLFEQVNITPDNFFCDPSDDVIWSPSGQDIYFTGYGLIYYGDSEIWRMKKDGTTAHPFAVARYPSFIDWMNEFTLVYTAYAGGGHLAGVMFDVYKEESIASGVVHGRFLSINNDYVSAYSGMDHMLNVSAAYLSTEEWLPGKDLESGINIQHLSWDYSEFRITTIFNSRFEDWRPNINDMLVLTWDSEISLWGIDLVHEPSVTNLQIWDIDHDELTMLVPDGIFGRFSPNGNHFVYFMPNEESPILHLMDYTSKNIIFSMPTVAETEQASGDFWGEVNTSLAFSPNGRFLTFFTPGILDTETLTVDIDKSNPILHLFDLDTYQIVGSFPANDNMPSWSPTNDKFIYRDRTDNWVLVEIENGRTIHKPSSCTVSPPKPIHNIAIRIP
jgi:hypothetical protein